MVALSVYVIVVIYERQT